MNSFITKSKPLSVIAGLVVAALMFFGVVFAVNAITVQEAIDLTNAGFTTDQIVAMFGDNDNGGDQQLSGDAALLDFAKGKVGELTFPPYIKAGSNGAGCAAFQT